jgi:hypothetical protein
MVLRASIIPGVTEQNSDLLEDGTGGAVDKSLKETERNQFDG